jgi:hypothetical protein
MNAASTACIKAATKLQAIQAIRQNSRTSAGSKKIGKVVTGNVGVAVIEGFVEKDFMRAEGEEAACWADVAKEIGKGDVKADGKDEFGG